MTSRFSDPSFSAPRVWRVSSLCLALLLTALGGFAAEDAPDAYITCDGTTWTLGTAAAERVVALEDGKLLLKGLRDKASGQTLLAEGAELAFALDNPENRITGASGGWKLVRAEQSKGPQGELELALCVTRDGIEATKHYVIYPQSSILREWVVFRNAGAKPVRLINPGFLAMRVRAGDPGALDFHWMTGGENQPGSWNLRTEKLSPGESRRFDSYEPFPLDTALPGLTRPAADHSQGGACRFASYGASTASASGLVAFTSARSHSPSTWTS